MCSMRVWRARTDSLPLYDRHPKLVSSKLGHWPDWEHGYLQHTELTIMIWSWWYTKEKEDSTRSKPRRYRQQHWYRYRTTVHQISAQSISIVVIARICRRLLWRRRAVQGCNPHSPINTPTLCRAFINKRQQPLPNQRWLDYSPPVPGRSLALPEYLVPLIESRCRTGLGWDVVLNAPLTGVIRQHPILAPGSITRVPVFYGFLAIMGAVGDVILEERRRYSHYIYLKPRPTHKLYNRNTNRIVNLCYYMLDIK